MAAWARPLYEASAALWAATAGLLHRDYRHRDPKDDAGTDHDRDVDVQAVRPWSTCSPGNGPGGVRGPGTGPTDSGSPGARVGGSGAGHLSQPVTGKLSER